MTDHMQPAPGMHRRDDGAEVALARTCLDLRGHALVASAVGLVVAAVSMQPAVPGAAVLVGTALLFLMPVAGGRRGPRGYAALWLAALGIGWGALAASAMHTHPPLVAIACMVGAWLAMMPSLLHVATASAIWTLLCMAPPVVASFTAYDDVAGVGAALVLIAGAGHLLSGALRRTARESGALAHDAVELRSSNDWLMGQNTELKARVQELEPG